MTNTIPAKKKQSIFPDFPRGTPVLNKTGGFTDNWHLGLSTIFQQLQKNFTNEGVQIPQLIYSDIQQIQEVYNPRLINKTLGNIPNISGKMVYDITNTVIKVFIITFATPDDPSSEIQDAVWKTVQFV